MGAVIQVWPDIFKVITKVLTLAVSQKSAGFDKHLSNMSQLPIEDEEISASFIPPKSYFII